MKNFLKRSITGFFFSTVLILAIALNPYSFALLFLLIITLSFLEIHNILLTKNIRIQLPVCLIFALLLFVSAFLYWGHSLFPVKYFVLILVFIPLVFFLEMINKRKEPLTNIAFTILSFIYIALPFALLNLFVFTVPGNYNPNILLGYIFIIWSYDTGAYISGIAIGKTPFMPKISPKKTWEGTLGGIILAVLIAYIISVFFSELTKIQWIILSLITITGSIMGDLSESLLKRFANIKDSGKLLPGHGGILDRFDSVLISSLLVFAYLCLMI